MSNSNTTMRTTSIYKVLFYLLLVLSASPAYSQSGKYTIVFLHKRTDTTPLPKQESERIMKGHMANMEKLAAQGKLLAAGPFEGGGGLFIMNTTSEDTVEHWIAGDPGIIARRWNIEVMPYIPVFNGVCPVSEPYEMTNYTFCRFDFIASKFSAVTYPQIIRRHDDYLKQLIKTGNVVTSAVFGKDDGGIIILKGEVQPDVFQMDPAVQEGLAQPQMKKLFIAKGSFCEK